MSVAVFDIDGVVADVRHRLHHLHGHHAWNAFFDDAASDPLLPEGATLVADLAREHDIVWLTGRPDWLRRVTTRWLVDNGLPAEELHMRGGGDFRPARIFKVDVLRTIGRRRPIAAHIDDDAEVVAAAVRAGYPSVLADWIPRDEAMREAQEKFGRT
jgi:phosphoglycolate phosphatase-like HAD superfamily hydrolase